MMSQGPAPKPKPPSASRSSSTLLLLLARLDLRDNRADAAAARLGPGSCSWIPPIRSALTLKRAVAAKLAEKAQPLPN